MNRLFAGCALVIALGAVVSGAATAVSNLALSGTLGLLAGLVAALVVVVLLMVIVSVRAYALGHAAAQGKSDEALEEMQKQLNRARSHAPKEISHQPYAMLAPPAAQPKRTVVRRDRRSAASSVAGKWFR